MPGPASPRPSFLLGTSPNVESLLSSRSPFASRARSALVSAGSLLSSAAGPASANASGTLERKQTWEEWARDWRGNGLPRQGHESLHLLPGWAVRKRRPATKTDEITPFDLHVSTLGFCTFVRDAQTASRTQRAFLRIAKTLAALPQLPDAPLTQAPFPPESSPSRLFESAPHVVPPTASNKQNHATVTSEVAFSDPLQLSLAHENFHARLRPFWSTVLPYRKISLTIYIVPLPAPDESGSPAHLEGDKPLLKTTFTTNAEGHFAQNLIVPWERLCTHPPSIEMACTGESQQFGRDWGLFLTAELLSDNLDSLRSTPSNQDTAPSKVDVRSASSTSTSTAPTCTLEDDTKPSSVFPTSTEFPDMGGGRKEQPDPKRLGKLKAQDSNIVAISEATGIRVISDLDDTVKHSDILAGPREVFRRLEDICVPRMDSLYRILAENGVSGYHFVSNSPFELHHVVTDFLRLNSFPRYFSLKFYGGRSIFTSLFEPPGERKRPSILEIMDAFDKSSFILFGDSGEQDLELYVSIARERPKQVAAIFIRDVTSGHPEKSVRSHPRNSLTADYRQPYRDIPPSDVRAQPSQEPDDTKIRSEDYTALSAAEQKILRRAALWESRVEKAIRDKPRETILSFFVDAEQVEELALDVIRALNR